MKKIVRYSHEADEDFKYSDTKVATIKVYLENGLGSFKARIQIPDVTDEYVELFIKDNFKNVQSWEYWDESNSKW